LISFNLRDSFEELVDVMRLRAVEKNIYLQLHFADGVAEQVMGDPGRIRQIMMNFISNAIKFTSHGGVFVEVDAKPLANGNARYIFSVEDTGIGIPEDKLETVFEEFTQADSSTTRKYGGTGLGLSICALLAKLMGGELAVSSREGQGSIFSLSIDLPLAYKETAEATSLPSLNAKQVLVLGDITGPHKLNQRWAQRWGADVVFVDGFEQLPADIVGRFDVLLIDQSVGDEVAMHLASQLRNEPGGQQLAIILLASTMVHDRGSMLAEKGFDAYLSRPVKEQQLYLTVAKAVESRQHGVRPNFINPFTFSEPKTDSYNVAEGKMRILLAEDNVVNQKVAIRMLQKLGCTIDVAANGSEAVKMWRQFPYDLIFMDCHMPVMDGYEATTEIRNSEAVGQHVPIVALTANALEGEAQVCAKVGMDGFVAKPVKISDLEKIVVEYSPRS
jgi:CheY-like chemotaxis protein